MTRGARFSIALRDRKTAPTESIVDYARRVADPRSATRVDDLAAKLNEFAKQRMKRLRTEAGRKRESLRMVAEIKTLTVRAPR